MNNHESDSLSLLITLVLTLHTLGKIFSADDIPKHASEYSAPETGPHYENTPIQIYRKFHLQIMKIFMYKNSDIFHISAQNIDCGYSLEPHRRGGSNEYHNLCFEQKYEK